MRNVLVLKHATIKITGGMQCATSTEQTKVVVVVSEIIAQLVSLASL
jgi:hypothetical protein